MTPGGTGQPRPSTLLRAQAAIEIERYPEAAALLTTHLAEHPDDGEALCLLAQSRLGVHDPVGALAAANAAVVADPVAEWPHRIASLALSRLGQKREAVRAAEQSVRLEPNAWQTHARLARTLAELGMHHPAWAEAMRAVSIAPDEPQTHRAVGDVARLAGWLGLAEQGYRRALALDPHDAAVVNDLGLVDERRGRLTAAMGRFSGAARLDPADPVGARNVQAMGWRLLKLAAGVSGAFVLFAVTLAGAVDEGAGWSLARSWFALGALSGLGGAAALTVHRIPAVARPVLRRMVTRSPWGLVWLLVQLAYLVVLAVLPWTHEPGTVTPVFFGCVVASLAAAAGSRRLPAARPPPGQPYGWFGGLLEPEPTKGRAFSWRRRGRGHP